MKYILIIGIEIIVFAFIFIVLYKKFNRWVNENKKETRPYTRLTMYATLVSLLAVFIMLIATTISAISLTDTAKISSTLSKGIAPIKPKISIKLVDEDYNLIFDSIDLTHINHLDNWKHRPVEEDIGFHVRNDGQGNTGTVNFYLEDLQNLFYTESISKEIEPLAFEYLEFKFNYKKCEGGEGEQKFRKHIKKCRDNPLKAGLIEWILKVDCRPCLSEVNPQCYSFYICVYNKSYSRDECKLQLDSEKRKLTRRDKCPEP